MAVLGAISAWLVHAARKITVRAVHILADKHRVAHGWGMLGVGGLGIAAAVYFGHSAPTRANPYPGDPPWHWPVISLFLLVALIGLLLLVVPPIASRANRIGIIVVRDGVVKTTWGHNGVMEAKAALSSALGLAGDLAAARYPEATPNEQPLGWWKNNNKSLELAQIEQTYQELTPLVEHSRAGDTLWLHCPQSPDTTEVPLGLIKSYVAWKKKATNLLKMYPVERAKWVVPMALDNTPTEHRVTGEVRRQVVLLQVLIAQIAERFDAR